ncbi:MAG: hypothetical protein GF307_10450 [candidate division Zixibacteria bacterium]|nr:hypothetical protein [candidate division Zixibacteria bacterium]
MKKLRVLFPVFLLAIIVTVILIAETGKTQYPCFHGYTYVDGVLTGNVRVNLIIEGETPMTVYSVNGGERHGSYSIGDCMMQGEYCLRARKDDVDPAKGTTHQGTKGTGGVRKDLYLTNTFSECEWTE